MSAPPPLDDERTPLLHSEVENPHHPSGEDPGAIAPAKVSSRIAGRIYVSHFLSTWNSRVFEFGAVLYLATIFSGTLLPMSVYALVRGIAAVLISPAVGQFIDNNDRLKVVRISIVVQRIAVATSCAAFLVMEPRIANQQWMQNLLLAGVTVLACVEKLCAIMNLVSVEKDWVVVCVENPDSRRVVNAQLRRIDLICKLLGPLFIALIDSESTRIAIIVNFGMNLVSVVIEYFTIAKVYYETPALQAPKGSARLRVEADNEEPRIKDRSLSHFLGHVRQVASKSLDDFRLYFAHHAFFASFAGALLYLTVLNFGGQMVTYLLAEAYNSAQVGIVRTVAVAFEVLATWVAPWLMSRIGAIRAGIWLLSWQMIFLVAGVAVFWIFADQRGKHLLSAAGLVGGTILSRMGLRGFDLCAQVIVQDDVEAENRGVFSSVEAAFQSGFELCAYLSTIVFFRPEQFRWPTLISLIAVLMAYVLFARFVLTRRHHLLHFEKISSCIG